MPETLPKGITKRGDSYRISVMVEGRRITKTCKTLREATEALDAIRLGLHPEGRVEAPWTFSEAYSRVVEEHVRVNATSERSIRAKTSNHKKVMEYFTSAGDRLLNSLTQGDVFKFQRWLVVEKGYAPAYCNNLLSSLSMQLHHAKVSGGYNPKVELEIPFVPSKRGRIRYITDDEERRMMDWCKHVCADDLADLIMVGLDTGMRIQEILSTEFRDCDLTTRQIHIWRTKSGTTRAVPMTARVLRAVRDRQLKSAAAKKPNLLFGGMLYQTAQRQWDTLRAGVGLKGDPHFTIHVMRHTCATRLVSRGVDIRTVKEWLGHSDVRTTMRYAQFVPSNMFSAVSALEANTVSALEANTVSALEANTVSALDPLGRQTVVPLL